MDRIGPFFLKGCVNALSPATGISPVAGFTQPFRRYLQRPAYRDDDVKQEGEGVLRRTERVFAVLDVGRDVGVEGREQPRLGGLPSPKVGILFDLNQILFDLSLESIRT